MQLNHAQQSQILDAAGRAQAGPHLRVQGERRERHRRGHAVARQQQRDHTGRGAQPGAAEPAGRRHQLQVAHTQLAVAAHARVEWPPQGLPHRLQPRLPQLDVEVLAARGSDHDRGQPHRAHRVGAVSGQDMRIQLKGKGPWLEEEMKRLLFRVL